MRLWGKHNIRFLAAAAVAMILAHPSVSDCTTSAQTGVQPSRRERTIYFSHQDSRLLVPGQRRSSVAYIAGATVPGARLPLLILLHGVNESQTLYPWFGKDNDVRPNLDQIARHTRQSFVVAAPTQTRNAWLPSTMWGEFNLAEFVRDLREALPEGNDVDLETIVLAGHSGAGCNPTGGLAHAAVSDIPLRGLAFIDTCFDVDVAERVSELGRRTPIWIYWQKFTWPRALEPFVAPLSRPSWEPVRVTEMQSSLGNPHVRIVYAAVDQVVREWLLDNPTPPTTEANSASSRPIAGVSE